MPKPNIRSVEERYGGEGHAGEDPYAGPRPDPHRDIPPDPSVEMPNATVQDLIDQPDPERIPAEADWDQEATNPRTKRTDGKDGSNEQDAENSR